MAEGLKPREVGAHTEHFYLGFRVGVGLVIIDKDRGIVISLLAPDDSYLRELTAGFETLIQELDRQEALDGNSG